MEPSSLQDAVSFTGRAHLAVARDLAAGDSGRARFGPGPVAVEVTLGFAKRDEEEEVDVLGCRLRLCAADGAWWQGSGEFSPSFLSPFEIEPQPQARFAAGSPASWTRALAERPLLSGVHDLWDDREHVELDLGERRIGVPLKYQGPILDLGLLADEDEGDRLVVRISRLHDEEVDEIDPFVYTLPLARLLDVDTEGAGWTPLHASATGDPEAVPLLLAAGATADAATGHGATPLAIAAEHVLQRSIERLKTSVEPDDEDARAERALTAAALAGDRELASSLLAAGTAAGTAFEAILTSGLPESVEALSLLLAAGADPNSVCRSDRVPALSLAVLFDRGGDLVLELLAAGASATPDVVAVAASRGAPGLLGKLLDAGAEPDAPTRHGSTPLVEAARAGRADSVRLLLDAGASAEAIDAAGRSALEVASMNGHQEVAALLATRAPQSVPTAEQVLLAVRGGDSAALRELLAGGAPASATTADGVPALVVAAAAGQADSAEVLLRHGAGIGQRDRDGKSALIAAAAAGHLAVVERLLAVDGRTEGVDLEGSTALWWAAKEGQVDVVERFLAAGADPSRAGRHGRTPLEAAIEAAHEKVVAALLAGGAGPDGIDGCPSPVGLAARKGLPGVVRRLLAAGGTADGTLVAGRTPLTWAIEIGNEEIVDLLLAAGADPCRRDGKGDLPLVFARRLGRSAIAARLEGAGATLAAADELLLAVAAKQAKRVGELLDSEPALARTPGALLAAVEVDNAALVEALLAAGADADERDHEGTPVLALAVLQRTEIVALLAAAGADLEARDGVGATALHRAAAGGRRAASGALLAAGAAVDARDASGATALMIAAAAGILPLVKELVAAGAAIDAEDLRGANALERAGTKPDVAAWLQKKGATAREPAPRVSDFYLPALQGKDGELVDLVARSRDLVSRDPMFGSPMDLAVATGNATLARLLVERGVPVNAAGGESGPLHVAAARGHQAVVEVLLPAGADPERRDGAGRTALHRAAAMGRAPVVQALLEAGCDRQAVDAEGLTAAEHARRNQNDHLFAAGDPV